MRYWTFSLLALGCMLLPMLQIAEAKAQEKFDVKKCETFFLGYTRMALLEDACKWDQQYSNLYAIGMGQRCLDYVTTERERALQLTDEVGYSMNIDIKRLGMTEFCVRSRKWYDTIASALQKAMDK